jgi:hypothetical protein
MGGWRDTWRVRGWFDDIEIELNPRSFDRDAALRTRSELALMLQGLGYPPEVRQVLFEVHERLWGFPTNGLHEDETRSLLASLEGAAMGGCPRPC